MLYNHIRSNLLSNVLSPVSTVNCQLQKLLSQKKGFSCPVPTLGGDGHFWTMAIDQIASSKWWCHIRTVLQSFNIFIKWYAAVLVVCTVHHLCSAQMALPLSSHLQSCDVWTAGVVGKSLVSCSLPTLLIRQHWWYGALETKVKSRVKAGLRMVAWKPIWGALVTWHLVLAGFNWEGFYYPCKST